MFNVKLIPPTDRGAAEDGDCGTLVITRRPRYTGRFKDKASKLVNAGTRVGMLWTTPDSKDWHCHVCNTDQPAIKFEDGQTDAWTECPNCHTPFIHALV